MKTKSVNLCVLVVTSSFSPAAFSLSIEEGIRNSSVYIVMKGQTENGSPQQAVGTGFIVSSDGHIITSYHLLSAITSKKVKLESIEITASVYDYDEKQNKVFIVDAKPNIDMLLLKIPRGPSGRKPVALAPFQSLQATLTGPEPLSFAGFRSDGGSPFWHKTGDSIGNTEGPGGYTVNLSKPVRSGQSGGPVYDNKGRVFGMLKGDIGDSALFVPIEYASSLLAGVATINPGSNSVEDFLKTDSAKKELSAWLTSYLKEKNGGKAVVEKEIDEYINLNSDQINKLLESRFDKYMRNVVAYSYSTEFLLSNDKKYGSMTFFKNNSDTGEVRCRATYPPGTARPKITYRFNDRQSGGEFKIAGAHEGPFAELLIDLPSENKYLWDAPPPGNNRNSQEGPNHRVNFFLEDTRPVKGAIPVNCAVQVVGSAKVEP